MKKVVSLVMTILLCASLCGCSLIPEAPQEIIPDITQIRSICELATLECYYHNVAKSEKDAGQGLTHWFEKDRRFWIEYTGVAKVGIDMTQVAMTIEGDTVSITIPDAKLISVNVVDETLNEDSYISTGDGLNKNKITAEDQTQAIKDAQDEMGAAVESNSTLLLAAQERAKELIENYIWQIGTEAGVSYNINWIPVDNSVS